MRSSQPGTGVSVSDQVAWRWRAADPLLPRPAPLSGGCGARLAVAGPDGAPAAAGTCVHWTGEPGSLDLAWGAARRFQLTARAVGPSIPAALTALLAQWRDHLAGLPEAADEDTAAVIIWPSRDIDGAAALIAAGFVPLTVIAARPAPAAVPAPAVPPGVTIRRAGPADLDAITELGLGVIRYDSHFGGMTDRAGIPQALRRALAELLIAPRPWVWLAERAGQPAGMLAAETPGTTGWISAMTRPDPVAYLMLLGVPAAERGRGVGTALTGHLHRELQAAGVAVTLLHYAQVNPLSPPFWSRQGYRPLWTCWETRPARSVRAAGTLTGRRPGPS
jgi:ribosomal protein S18 acetylase RimI-like enzyme